MTTPKFNTDISMSSIIHLVVLLGTIAIAYGQFSAKVDEALDSVKVTQRQVNRIEHYIMTQDPKYWEKVTANGDNK